MNILPRKVLIDQFFLFSNWFRASINLLQHNLHHTGLALRKHLHFSYGFFVDALALRNGWRLEPMDYSISVLILPLLKMSLNLLWVV